ncbi:MAG: shikimate kinase, partial [Aquamicrobium sp.]|nr:shikimate kinase [Aquamicrobium sp.]
VYALADITVETRDAKREIIADETLARLGEYLGRKDEERAAQ